MLFIIRVQLDLIVSREPIHEGHSFKPTRIVNHNISDGQWKLILRTGGVEITVIDTNLNFPFFLRTGTMLATQSGCCSSRMKPHTMSLWTSASIASIMFGQSSLLLLDWLGIRLDIRTMHGYLRIKFGHVFIVPCKDIDILSYEYNQFFFLRK